MLAFLLSYWVCNVLKIKYIGNTLIISMLQNRKKERTPSPIITKNNGATGTITSHFRPN